MSDVMLHGVLNIPPELWSGDALDEMQRHDRYVQASELIQSLQQQCDALQAESKVKSEEIERCTNINYRLHLENLELQADNTMLHETFKDASLTYWSSGGFGNQDCDMGRITINLPIIQAKELMEAISLKESNDG